LSDRRKILVIRDGASDSFQWLDSGSSGAGSLDCEITTVSTPLAAVARLKREAFDALCVPAASLQESLKLGRFLQYEQILEEMPDGAVLIDSDNCVVWANQQFISWCDHTDLTGKNFYEVLGRPEIIGPDYCPFHSALHSGKASNSTLRLADHRYLQIHAAPVITEDGESRNLIVTIRDVTEETLQQQKLAAIHKAGVELADLTPEELYSMEVDERIALLKSNILHFTKDLLNFDVVEIRLLDQESGELEPLLSVGIDQDAARRMLYADAENNGVTGFVAATGKSYLCENTKEDPLYIQGFEGAKSSLTVPLVLHDQVIGTFNVESPEPRAFTESDLQFLEIFSRDVAVALNTLELLVAQEATAAQKSVEAIHSAVALPVDEILNDAVNVMERYIGHEPEVVERLQHILLNARDIKQVIQKVGQRMTPSQAVPNVGQIERRPVLKGQRVLVVDDDANVRSAAHSLLERYGSIVETAHEGGEAIFMIRSSGAAYDVIISDIRLPDMSGSQLLRKLQDFMGDVPMILMTGFGYDPGHSIVKARQSGLRSNAVLYKPFRLDQLLEVVEAMVQAEPKLLPH